MTTVLARVHLIHVCLCLIGLFGVACGGASGASAGQRSVARTAGGTEVTVTAHNYWQDGLEALEKAKRGGYQVADCAAAVRAFEEAVEAAPKFAEAIYMQGLANYRCGHPREAVSLYEAALRVNSALCPARVGVGVELAKADNQRAAEAAFVQAITADPQCAEAYVNLAIIQRRRPGDSGEALKNLRRALAIDAQYLPAFNEMALLYFAEAEDNKKKLDLAEVVCSQAQKIDAEYAPIYNTWGLIDLRRGKIIEASAKFQKAFQLDPEMFEAYMNFAQITLGFRGYADAVGAFKKALELKPDSFDALVGLGVAYRGLEQNDKAIEAYEKARKLDPGRAEPYYNLGVLYQDFQSGAESDMNEAQKYYQQFLRKAGGDTRFADAVQDVTRKCEKKGRRRQGRNKCIAGRLQNIDNYRQALREMEEMEKLQKQAEAEAAALEAQTDAEGPSPPEPSPGVAEGEQPGTGGGAGLQQDEQHK